MAERITPREKDFSQWYLDIIQHAQLADNSPVRGCMVLRPNGYGLWEVVQEHLNKAFKATGHRNAYFPMFIPQSFLQKEKDHVEGFLPQCAVVTHGGGKELDEPLIVRPTSETIINAMYSKWIQSYRDLPMLINQWANVVRWELRTRPFLRTVEFLWQEGHTCHETDTEALKETLKMLDVYQTFMREIFAIPCIPGEKTPSEKFAGAAQTYCLEAMMQDKKALQAGTSHNLGQNFAKAFNTAFQGRDGKQHHVWQTSWGVSTRLIGALIMTHSDDAGFVVPPKLAATHVAIIVIGKTPEERTPVIAKAQALAADLRKHGLGVIVDDDETKGPGFKYFEYELTGVCIRIELGPKDLAKDQCVMVRRDTKQKDFVPLAQAVEKATTSLEAMQKDLFTKAKKFQDDNTFEINSHDEMKAKADAGFLLAHWCEKVACENQLKQESQITTRNRPFNLKQEPGKCVVCGSDSPGRIVFAKSY